MDAGMDEWMDGQPDEYMDIWVPLEKRPVFSTV